MLCKPRMKALTVVLCVLLFFAALAAVAILDVRLATSKANIQRIVGAALSAPVQRRHAVLPAAVGVRLSAASKAPGASDTENALIAWLCETLEAQYGDRINISAEQVQRFLDKSTVKDYLGDKLASYASDLLNGTEDTFISADEIRALMEENADLIQSEFGIAVTDQVCDFVTDFVEAQDVNTVIRKQVIQAVRDTQLADSSSSAAPSRPGEGTTVADVLDTLRDATSLWALALAILLCLGLCVGIFFTTGRNAVKTLRCAGIPILVLGILLAIPTAGIQLLIGTLLTGVAGRIAETAVAITAAVHYCVLALGILLLIAAVTVRKTLEKTTAKAK